jgi:hypothetical protein
MDYTNKTLTLNDGITYVVVEQVDYDDKTYLYIVNSEDEKDTSFIELNGGNLSTIDPVLFKNVIFPLFKEKFEK